MRSYSYSHTVMTATAAVQTERYSQLVSQPVNQ